MSLDISLTAIRPTEVYEANITHNLNKMAEAAGIYKVIWRPEECGVKKAGDIISALEKGLDILKSNREIMKGFAPENGWGSYGEFVVFVERYLNACRKNPDAEISVWR